MPAFLTTGISTGVRISIVGVKSSAVPTITTITIITNISSVLLPMKGCEQRRPPRPGCWPR